MEAVVYGLGDKISGQQEGATLRIAYILSEKIVSAGQAYGFIKFNHYYSSPRPETMLKLVAEEADRQNLPQTAENMRQDLKFYQQLKKIKHLNAQQLRAKLAIEKQAEKQFAELRQLMFNRIKETGMPQIEELFDEDENNMTLIAVRGIAPETDSDEYLPASRIMQLDKEIFDEECTFFCLTPEFFNANFKEGKNSSRSVLSANADGYLHKLFHFPNVNSLLASELRSVRKELLEISVPFRTTLKEWISMVRNGCKAEESSTFFEKELLPAAAPVSKSLEENSILLHTARFYNDLSPLHVYFGELPVMTVWNFYRSLEALQDETWKKLEEVMKESAFETRRLPVMAVFLDEDIFMEMRAADEVEAVIQPVKKSISID